MEEAVRLPVCRTGEYNTRNSDIITKPINLIPHKKFSVGS